MNQHTPHFAGSLAMKTWASRTPWFLGYLSWVSFSWTQGMVMVLVLTHLSPGIERGLPGIDPSSSWWLHQPIWKILVKLESFPNFRSENNEYLKPPSHHLTIFHSYFGIFEYIILQSSTVIRQGAPLPFQSTGFTSSTSWPHRESQSSKDNFEMGRVWSRDRYRPFKRAKHQKHINEEVVVR